MTTPVGADKFVARVTLDTHTITAPTLPTITDADGDLGDAAGATYTLVGVVGPTSAPTGYIVRRAT